MRILQVVGRFDPVRCGVAHYTARLADGLAAADLTVAVASPAPAAESVVPLLPIRAPRWDLPAIVDLLKISYKWRADWLHLQFAPGSFRWSRAPGLLPVLSHLVPRSPRIAVTVHEYGGWPLRAPRPFARLVDALGRLGERAGLVDRELLTLLSLSDLSIVTNRAHRQAIARASARLAARLHLVPIGPNVGPELVTDQDRASSRRALGVAPDRLVVVCFGFVHPVKGIETLLAAMQVCRASWPGALLWIVGGIESLVLRGAEADDYERRVRWLIRDLGLEGSVELTGYLPDREAALRLRAADLAVLPFNRGVTLKSGALVTCLRFGLPVLATLGGDLADLRHGEQLWLVPPKNPLALAAALCLLAADPSLRNRLGRAGTEAARGFDWALIARRHRELYADPRAGATD